jgi:endoglucanase
MIGEQLEVRMRRRLAVVAALAAAVLPVAPRKALAQTAAPPSTPAASTAPAIPPLAAGTANGFAVKRGTNVSHWLSQSQRRSEERRQWFTAEDVKLVAKLGFDHLRLPVDEEQLWDEAGQPQEEAFALLDAALDWCAASRLRAIVDLHILRSHHFNEGTKPLWRESAAQERFLEVWRQLSVRLAKRPNEQVAYEVMNEPVADDPEVWNSLLARSVAVIRQREPQRTIVIGSNMWQSADTFDRLRIPTGDPNILLSFHSYTPMPLTHYGASWTKVGEYKGAVRYPGEVVADADLAGLPADLLGAIGKHRYFDRSVLEEQIAKPIAVARATGLPLYCGEWGALPSVPRADRLRWYTDFRAVLEKYGIGWATWDYKGGFGLVSGTRSLDQGLLDVLVGTPKPEPTRSTALGVFEKDAEVGDVKLPGATVLDTSRGEYRLTGSGSNIWGTADAFHFAAKPVAGDVDLAAAIRFVGEGKNPHRKAGLMLRASSAADSPYVHAVVHGDGLVSLQYRETAGGETKEVKAQLKTVPAQLALHRRGDVFTMLAGAPGTPLQRAAALKLALPASVLAGLAVSSHEADWLETAVFSRVEVKQPPR